MPLYSIFGLPIVSTEVLPELQPLRDGTPILRYRVFDDEVFDDEDGQTSESIQEYSFPEGWSIGFRFSRAGDTMIVRYPGRAEFHIYDRFTSIAGWITPGKSVGARHRLLSHVIPLALAAQRQLLLHAGGVVVGGGAVLLTGHSGRGKSTLVAALARRGAVALTDDSVRLYRRNDGWAVAPAYRGHKLWPDSVAWLGADPTELAPISEGSEKRSWSGERWWPDHDHPHVRSLILLQPSAQSVPGGGVKVTLACPRPALLETLQNVYNVPSLADRGAWVSRLEIAGLIERCPVFTLEYERNYEILDRVADVLLETVTAQ